MITLNPAGLLDRALTLELEAALVRELFMDDPRAPARVAELEAEAARLRAEAEKTN
jgi:hypothetical protein